MRRVTRHVTDRGTSWPGGRGRRWSGTGSTATAKDTTMPTDVPDAAVQAAMARRADLLSDRPDPTALSDWTLTRLMLEAAAPILAEEVAREILAYAERQFPKNDPARV